MFNEALKSIFDVLVGDLISNTRNAASGGRAITGRRFAGIPNDWPRSVLQSKRNGVSSRISSTKISISAPLWHAEKEDAERITGELFAHWMEEPDDLPRNYRDKNKSAQEPLPRVICDYIAGMTDPFIYQQYEKYCCDE